MTKPSPDITETKTKQTTDDTKLPNVGPAMQRILSKDDLADLNNLISALQRWDDQRYELKWEIIGTYAIDDEENLPTDISQAVDLMTGIAESFYSIRDILEARRDSAVVSDDEEDEEGGEDEEATSLYCSRTLPLFQ